MADYSDVSSSQGLRSDLRALSQVRPIVGLRWRDLIRPVAAACITLIAALTLTVVSAWLITKAWQMPPVLDLTVAVTAVRALGISRALFRYLDRLASHDVALRCAENVRVNAYRILATCDPTVVVRMSRGALLTRFGSDVDAVSDVVVRAVVPGAAALVVSASAVGFAALLSPWAAVALSVGLLVAGIAAPAAVARSTRVTEARRAGALESLTTNVDHVLANAPALRVSGHLPQALDLADSSSRRLSSADEAGASADATGAAIGVWSHAFTVIAVVMVASIGYLTGDRSPQWLGALALLSLAAFEAVAALPAAAVAVTRAAGAARRLTALSSASLTDDGRDPEPLSPAPYLAAHNLVVGRDSDLQSWDLDLPFGSRELVVAPSGSGKTTLLLTLAGLLPARSGEVLLDNTPTDELPPSVLRGTVLFVAEDSHIFATTVRDNLAVGAPRATDEQIHDVLDAVGLTGWTDSLPDGLSTILTSGDNSLSGGQRRRLILARALLSDAPILLLDEPTEHLDAEGDSDISELLGFSGPPPPLPGALAQRSIVMVRHPRT